VYFITNTVALKELLSIIIIFKCNPLVIKFTCYLPTQENKIRQKIEIN